MRIKTNGRKFEMIKYRNLGYEQHLKYDSISQVGDVYVECEDGWFLNTRTNSRTNILYVDNYKEYYREV